LFARSRKDIPSREGGRDVEEVARVDELDEEAEAVKIWRTGDGRAWEKLWLTSEVLNPFGLACVVQYIKPEYMDSKSDRIISTTAFLIINKVIIRSYTLES
jgi:hypothetical protein